jgi:hypothetical protein
MLIVIDYPEDTRFDVRMEFLRMEFKDQDVFEVIKLNT